MPTPPVLQTIHLAIGYDHPRRLIRERLSLAIDPGEVVCLIGPNGAGKSTLLRTLAGMQPPLAGEVRLQAHDLHKLSARERARLLAVVLTERIDGGLLTGYGLVALGRHPYTDWTGQLSADDEQRIAEAVAMVGGEALAARRFSQLSDGEQQRLLIARALAQEPALLLLDEPTAYLDLPRRAEVFALLRDLARRTGRAVLLSTHDLDLALRTADRIWLLPASGEMVAGVPEDLVLNGSFAAAFAAEGVQFDPQTGSFRLRTHTHGSVALTGSGLALTWTARALERAGYALDPASPLRVRVADDGWHGQHGQHSQQIASIESLIEWLQMQA